MPGLAMVNLHTKFEVSMFPHHEDMKNNAKCRILGGLGVRNHLRSPAMSYLLKVADFNLFTPPAFVAPEGVTPFEFLGYHAALFV